MTPEQLDAHVARVREQRMAALRHYEEAQQAKAKMKEEKDIAAYEKRLEQVGRVIEAIEKQHQKLDKYMAEIYMLRMSVGDTTWQR